MKIDPSLAAAAGFVGVLAFYFGVLSLLNSPEHAIGQFRGDYWWVFAFALGMAGQLWIGARISAGMAAIGTSGGTSGTAMLACCAHHAVGFAPLAGFAFIAPFFDKYQPLFIGIGLVSNIAGISVAMERAQVLGAKVPFAQSFAWEGVAKLVIAAGSGLLAGLALKIYAG
ncbi:hypothetical protein HY995_02405 [Candidatus Micrarchaeota archaeon]|nr:hypothetical protein [Candidatus Micrarchaeota archaeon]